MGRWPRAWLVMGVVEEAMLADRGTGEPLSRDFLETAERFSKKIK